MILVLETLEKSQIVNCAVSFQILETNVESTYLISFRFLRLHTAQEILRIFVCLK